MVADANIKGRRRTMVYMLSHTGQPLMPTEDHRKVRLLLKDKKAKVVKRTPLTVQLLSCTHEYKQPVNSWRRRRVPGTSVYPHVRKIASSTLKTCSQGTMWLKTCLIEGSIGVPDGTGKRAIVRPRFDNRVHSKHKRLVSAVCGSQDSGAYHCDQAYLLAATGNAGYCRNGRV